ncbi:hypothetical protein Ae201684P_002563 [Aphanomyces euteiches]|uniref:Uncharacterized protein n=1 Tax=Aphanomyces euteiches TaxID=100861 RepID=A0A6G0X559_9STRA|nr:hypothetical protein Ae201684_008458 [Aphanomyces euteiches]KAH9070195.1 hypothetical protein Ae201684P_002563 [Aphanomyces euteiches]
MTLHVPLPTTITVFLSVKVGKPHGESRTYAEPGASFAFDIINESHGVLRLKVSERVAQVVQRYDAAHATTTDRSTLLFDETFSILLKPAATTPQEKYTVIDESNFKDMVKVAWNNHNKRNSGGDFKLELFVYLERQDRSSRQIRRSDPKRRAELAQRILSQDRQSQPGPSELQYVSTVLSRQLTEPDIVNLPENPTVLQLRHFDHECAALQSEREARLAQVELDYRPLRFMVNGSVLNQLVNIADLLSILGLPQFDLYAPYIPPTEVAAPETNMHDIDHE